MKKKAYRKTIKSLLILCDKLADDVAILETKFFYLKKAKEEFKTPSKAITPVVDNKQTERIIELKKENEELKQANGELCIKLEKAEKMFQEEKKIKE